MNKAAEKAQATEFISVRKVDLIQKSHKVVLMYQEDKAKITIARALAKNSEIFIFDDSFQL